MSIPALIGEGHSPSKFGPGFGKKAGQLRFFAGHTDRRYPIPGELGSNEHLNQGPVLGWLGRSTGRGDHGSRSQSVRSPPAGLSVSLSLHHAPLEL